MAWILFSATALFLLVASHPFVTYPLSLWVLGRFRSVRLSDGRAPEVPLATFSLCVCASDEESSIERTINSLLELRRRTGDVQLLVYVDGATDAVADIVRQYADRIDLVVSSERRGKNYGLNRLAEMISGDIVVLMDADAEVEWDALIKLRRYFADPAVGCVCGHVAMANPDGAATVATGSRYRRLEEGIKKLESDTGSTIGADGRLYAIRRECHQMIPYGLADDMYLSLAVLCDGYRVVWAEDVRSYERSVPFADEEFHRKIGSTCQGFSTHLALWPRIRSLDVLTVYKYISHKLLRWLMAPALLCAGTFALAGVAAIWGFERTTIAGVAGLVLIWMGGKGGFRPITSILDISRSFIATAIGVCRALNGPLVGTWETAASVRNTGELGL